MRIKAPITDHDFARTFTRDSRTVLARVAADADNGHAALICTHPLNGCFVDMVIGFGGDEEGHWKAAYKALWALDTHSAFATRNKILTSLGLEGAAPDVIVEEGEGQLAAK